MIRIPETMSQLITGEQLPTPAAASGSVVFPLGLATLVVALLLTGCAAESAPGSAGLRVVATIYPLQYFAAQVGGEQAQVTGLVPAGVEAHDWEPAPQHLTAIEKAAVFVYNGAGFEPWVDRMLGMLKSERTIVVNATEGLSLRASGEAASGPPDPHVWLDPLNARAQVSIIRDALVRADPKHEDLYRANAQKLAQRLETMHRRFEAGLSQCQRRDIIVAHDAFQYLADRYNVRVHSIAGVSPDVEPSPSQLATLVKEARAQGATHIFFETLVNPALARTLAKEVGAETLVLNPLEGLTKEEAAAGEDYFTVMEQNLKNLQKALGCQVG